MKLLVIGHRIFYLQPRITELSGNGVVNCAEPLEIFYLEHNVNSINCARDLASSNNIRQFTSLERTLATLPPGNYTGMVMDIFLDICVRKNNVDLAILEHPNNNTESLAPILLRATNNTIWNEYHFLYFGKILFLPIMFVVLFILVIRYYNIFDIFNLIF
jgi:hypothetical protein